jgi:hypothetical protein
MVLAPAARTAGAVANVTPPTAISTALVPASSRNLRTPAGPIGVFVVCFVVVGKIGPIEK